jgi:hypothetical protein
LAFGEEVLAIKSGLHALVSMARAMLTANEIALRNSSSSCMLFIEKVMEKINIFLLK